MKVFEFVYNECVWESSSRTVSIHKTLKGAEMALDFHRQKAREEYEEMYVPHERKEHPFGDMEYWGIIETEVED